MESLDAPVDLETAFIGNLEATSILKDFVQGVYEDDLSDVQQHLEPTFFKKAQTKLAEAHGTL